MEIKDKMMNEMKSIERVVEDLKRILTPIQTAKFLLISDKVSFNCQNNILIFYV